MRTMYITKFKDGTHTGFNVEGYAATFASDPAQLAINSWHHIFSARDHPKDGLRALVGST